MYVEIHSGLSLPLEALSTRVTQASFFLGHSSPLPTQGFAVLSPSEMLLPWFLALQAPTHFSGLS